MAEDAYREATKVRLLAMAADYEVRAGIAIELTDADPGEANSELVEATTDEAPKTNPGRKIATGLKETVLVQRRPVGRPRQELHWKPIPERQHGQVRLTEVGRRTRKEREMIPLLRFVSSQTDGL
jgi:hypothetical protein